MSVQSAAFSVFTVKSSHTYAECVQ